MSESSEPRGGAPAGFARFGAELEVLLVTKGHPFERDPFFAVFAALAVRGEMFSRRDWSHPPGEALGGSTSEALPHAPDPIQDGSGIQLEWKPDTTRRGMWTSASGSSATLAASRITR